MIQFTIRHLLIIIILFTSTNALADVNCNDISSPTVQGNITPGDYQQLVKCLVKFTEHGKPAKKELKGGYYGTPVGWVYFNSIGGDVNEAIKIGRFLRQGLAEVAIKYKCYSACFLAVVGSVKLYAGEPFGKVGIHRMFHDAETLKQVDILEYERYYNDAKKKIRLYFLDLDVPTSIVEKMFSIPSSEIYILNHSELSLLNNHPAYEEWISARCPNPLTEEERLKYQDHISSGPKKGKEPDDSIENIKRLANKHDKCINDIRWDQFKSIVSTHYKRLTAQEQEISKDKSKWVPKLEHRVTDLAELLSEKQRYNLISMLEKYEKETAHQIFVLTVPTLHGESIKSFSLRVANAWGVGYRNLDNGVLITVVSSEKSSRIEVGYGLELFITDKIAKNIMYTDMIPYFKEGNYYKGIDSGIVSLMKVGRQYTIPPDKWPDSLK